MKTVKKSRGSGVLIASFATVAVLVAGALGVRNCKENEQPTSSLTS